MTYKAGPSTPPSSMDAPPSSAFPSDGSAPAGAVFRGIPGSPGVAVGPALVIGDSRAVYTRRHIHAAQIDAEIGRVAEAVLAAKTTLKEVSQRLEAGPAHDTTPILDAYLVMLSDPLLHEAIVRKITDERKCAEWAVASASEEISRLFLPQSPNEKDSYIVERRHDVEFVGDRLLRALMGDAGVSIPRLSEPTIIVARDLSPADTAGMVKEPAIGLVTEVGTRTSHTSIMARALEIPAVVGVEGALYHIRTGDTLIVDGLRGEITIRPSEMAIADARARAARHLAFARDLLSTRDRPCVTACGTPVALRANVELPAEAILALDHGADGIGLYRTEFLYIDRLTQPDENEQYEIYRAVIEAVAPRPVILRTFDIGGDKFASSFKLPAEMNPALGLRAVRLALSQPDVFLTQLRAMVSGIHELREVRKLLTRAIREVEARGLAHAPKIPLGVMIEVPSAAVMADVFAKEAEFFSVGTNDLIQYALAIDRTSQSLATLASPFDPAIVRLIAGVVRAAKDHGIPVSLCGAMASDPLAATLLLGLGLRELSMEAAAIPELKEAIRRVTIAECEGVAAEALASDTAERVESAVAKAFAPRLYDLLTGNDAQDPSSSEPALER